MTSEVNKWVSSVTFQNAIQDFRMDWCLNIDQMNNFNILNAA